ncbi:hypothetical protein ACE2AJ_03795 [Aquihabitans daechungensis]|uniref:hypothetical protein n=1 Tax=Aquihabitans daechungensis TaxID=1052257 RepID=UPI003BA0FF12
MADVPIREVHLVAKTHLDLGFTALAAEVEAQYLDDFFPRAIAVARSLRDRGGAERLTWTTGRGSSTAPCTRRTPSAPRRSTLRCGPATWRGTPWP